MQGFSIAVKTLSFFFWCFLVVPLQALVMCFTRGPKSYTIPIIWQKGVCKIFGIRTIVEGTIHQGQTLFVCNHVSYLDIPAMATVLKASFVAKKEVAGWPVIGFLSRLQQTAFISRSRGDAQKEKNALANMIAEGKSLILFPEGTSTDGTRVEPFKSSLFSLTLDDQQNRTLMIQPVTLTIELIDGKAPETQALRDLYAWYGDLDMLPHLVAFAKTSGTTVRLVFHDPVDPSAFADRKALAEACWETVRGSLNRSAQAGRPIASGLAA